jgi:hypothetical protein
MLVPSLTTLVIASVAVFFSLNTSEEIVKVATAFVAGLCLFFSLFFAPVVIKLVIIAVPLLGKRLQTIDQNN